MSADNEEETQRAVKAHTMMAANMITDGLYGSSLMNDATLTNDMMALLQGEEAFKKYVDESYDSSADFWKLKVENGKIMMEYDGENDVTTIDADGNKVILRSHNPQLLERIKTMGRQLASLLTNPNVSAEQKRGIATQFQNMLNEYIAGNHREDHKSSDVYQSLESTLTGKPIRSLPGYGGSFRKEFVEAIKDQVKIGREGSSFSADLTIGTKDRVGTTVDMTDAIFNRMNTESMGWVRDYLGNSNLVENDDFTALMNNRAQSLVEAQKTVINGDYRTYLNEQNFQSALQKSSDAIVTGLGMTASGLEGFRTTGEFGNLLDQRIAGYATGGASALRSFQSEMRGVYNSDEKKEYRRMAEYNRTHPIDESRMIPGSTLHGGFEDNYDLEVSFGGKTANLKTYHAGFDRSFGADNALKAGTDVFTPDGYWMYIKEKAGAVHGYAFEQIGTGIQMRVFHYKPGGTGYPIGTIIGPNQRLIGYPDAGYGTGKIHSHVEFSRPNATGGREFFDPNSGRGAQLADGRGRFVLNYTYTKNGKQVTATRYIGPYFDQ